MNHIWGFGHASRTARDPLDKSSTAHATTIGQKLFLVFGNLMYGALVTLRSLLLLGMSTSLEQSYSHPANHIRLIQVNVAFQLCDLLPTVTLDSGSGRLVDRENVLHAYWIPFRSL